MYDSIGLVAAFCLKQVTILGKQCELIDEYVMKYLFDKHNKIYSDKLSIKLVAFCSQVRVLAY